MVVIFSDGFESPPNTPPSTFTAWSGENDDGTSTITMTAGSAHTGSYGAIASLPGSGSDYANVYKTIAAASVVYTRLYFKVSALPDLNKSIQIISYNAGSGLPNIYLKQTAGGVQIIGMQAPNGLDDDYPSYVVTLLLNTWYCLELYCKVDAVAGETTAWLNGTPIMDDAGVDTTNWGNITSVSVGVAYSTNTSAVTVSIDDVVIADSYIGPLASAPLVTWTRVH